jgi:dipeptidyl-peptidase-4
VYGADEEGIVYFSSNQENVTERHIYGIRLDGGGLGRLTHETGWHRADFSPQFDYFIHSYSNSTTPTRVTLCSSDGNTVSTLIENRMEELDNYQLSHPEFMTVTTEDGVELNARIMLPRDFDANKKYPVLISCYGGPWQVVRNNWGGKSFLWHNLFAQHGYIVFSIDNRGTTGRGKAFVNLVYGDLGKWAVHDHIEAAKYLAGLPYVDKDRIGIFGWSFGGYLTLLAMTKGAGYFSTGVAGAPVVCFRLYDTIYTERYMRSPGCMLPIVRHYLHRAVYAFS